MSRLPGGAVADFARDALRGPGVVLGVLWLLVAVLARGTAGPGTLAEGSVGLLRTVVGQSSMIVVLLLMNRIVAADREGGFYRAFFAKPVDPVAFYLAKFAVLGAIAVGYVALQAVAVSLATGHVAFEASLLTHMAIRVLLLGGLVFALSTVTRVDTVTAIVLFTVQSILHGIHAQQPEVLSAFWRLALAVLPPFHVAAAERPELAAADLVHALGYGLALVVVGAAAIRLRPMGSGGRA